MSTVSPEVKVPVEVDGRTLTLTNLGKVLYPDSGFTKAEVLDYYQRVAPALLPHIAGRPLTAATAGTTAAAEAQASDWPSRRPMPRATALKSCLPTARIHAGSVPHCGFGSHPAATYVITRILKPGPPAERRLEASIPRLSLHRRASRTPRRRHMQRRSGHSGISPRGLP